MTVIVTMNYENSTMQNKDYSRRRIDASWHFTEYNRGRISGEIIHVLENTSDPIIISSTFSEITSIS